LGGNKQEAKSCPHQPTTPVRLSCECGWEGMATEAYGELYEEVLDFECPKCDKSLLVVNLIVAAEKYYNWKNKNK
jgi:hypothetical protein